MVHILVPAVGLQAPSASWVLTPAPPLGLCVQFNGWLRESTSVFVRHLQSLSGDTYSLAHKPGIPKIQFIDHLNLKKNEGQSVNTSVLLKGG